MNYSIYSLLKKCFGVLVISCVITSCKPNTNNGNVADNTNIDTAETKPQQSFEQPDFNADSAYNFIQKQVDFGPRVPGTKAHEKCAQYLYNKLKKYTPDVEMQIGMAQRYDGKQLPVKNIIAHFGPENTNRILLSAHWDTRPWADQEDDAAKHNQPIDGANDGGSGVGVLLEIARQFSINQPKIGVIIVLFDVEDQGTPSFDENKSRTEDTYCLGSQYWAKNLDKTKYTASKGINLDMVGARDARFQLEENSRRIAPDFLTNVWRHAYMLGFSNYFINNLAPGVIDDHLYVSDLAQIPTIDIIDYDGARQKGFGHYWHTTNDNMEIIDRGTLNAVGKTVLSIVRTEKPQPL